MNTVQDPSARPAEAPAFPHIRARVIWPFAVIVIAAAHFVFWRPGLLIVSYSNAPGIALTLLLIAIAGYGLAALIALLFTNARRWRAILRPSGGKVICALALMFVTPMIVLHGMPLAIGAMYLAFAFENATVLMWSTTACLAVTLAWYPVCGLIISGTHTKWLRFGLFCLMFWTVYAGHILYTGV